jgi:hypothetical protein
VRRTARIISGDGLLGRVVNALGQPDGPSVFLPVDEALLRMARPGS